MCAAKKRKSNRSGTAKSGAVETNTPIEKRRPDNATDDADTHPVTHENKVSFRAILLTVFIVSALAGFLTGRARSPNYDNAGEAKAFIEAHLTQASEVEVPIWQLDRDSSGISGVHLKGGVIKFACGFEDYRRDLTTGGELKGDAYEKRFSAFVLPESKPPNDSQSNTDLRHQLLSEPMPGGLLATTVELAAKEPDLSRKPRHGASINEVIGVMLGGAELYSVKYASSEIKLIGRTWAVRPGRSDLEKRFNLWERAYRVLRWASIWDMKIHLTAAVLSSKNS